jgi:hypothetical protein
MVAAILVLSGVASAVPGDNFYKWDWGNPEDVDITKVPSVFPSERIGDAGVDGGVKFRWVKANTFQVMMTMPAFDFDAADYGTINHAFYLTVKFKDVADKAITVCAQKGGCGFYGAGRVGTFGGAADGKWKEETLVIPRSMMRSANGKTFQLKFIETRADVPVASLTLFSADTKMPGAKEAIAAAEKFQADKREALRQRLLPGFKDLGLPDPGPTPDYTAEEKARGFRVFFPPVSRPLFANSEAQEGELTNELKLYACPGQTVPVVVAIRALSDLGKVEVKCARAPAVRWAVYSEQRIGSSWGKDYRVCPEQLVLRRSQEVRPERLEIACLAVKVPENARPGESVVPIEVTGEKGAATFQLRLTVYPFKLERPDHSTHGQFYYIDYGDYDPLELEDMRDHGMDMVVSGLGIPVDPGIDGKLRTDATRKAFAALKKFGYRSPLVDNTGYMNGLVKDEKNRKRYAEIIAETLKIAKEEGFGEMGFFPVDEPHTPPLQQLAKVACTWTHDVPGANAFITSNPNAVPVLNPVLNYVCYNLTYLNAQSVASMQPHQKLMFYCPSIDVNPEYNRYRPGFYMFKVGAFSSQYFAYMEFAGDPFCDLDGDNRDWNVVYPSMDSTTHDPTLEWEAMREGVYDYRYAWTLKAAADRARAKGKAAEADKAMAVLNEVLAAVDVDGKKAGGPAIAIEADTRLKDRKLDPQKLAEAKALIASGWYDQSRRKIAQAIIDLKKAVGE